jgi:pilus assembly protein CpaB
VVGKTATLELTPRQVETVELSRQIGTLSLALRSIADAGKRKIKVEMIPARAKQSTSFALALAR